LAVTDIYLQYLAGFVIRQAFWTILFIKICWHSCLLIVKKKMRRIFFPGHRKLRFLFAVKKNWPDFEFPASLDAGLTQIR
jgi:hypothetical protein